ncbi:hypothetical protein M405DRAFT_858890 [Rhizopogon salebrosus TDB-379]|nr:hypothetical protein M405DRAFT_858890 [Rhizopogon salebrosus TDB-379]
MEDEGIAWQERRPTIVDVPHAQGQRRNASAREVRLKREKEKNAKKAPAGSSQLPQTSVTQQSDAASETQPSSQSNATVSSSSTTPAFIATSAAAIPMTSPPDNTLTVIDVQVFHPNYHLYDTSSYLLINSRKPKCCRIGSPAQRLENQLKMWYIADE